MSPTYGAVSGYGKIGMVCAFSWFRGSAVLRIASRSSARVSLPSARYRLAARAEPEAMTCPARWPTLVSPMRRRTSVRTVPKMPAVYGVAADVPPKAHWETVPVRQADGRFPSPHEERCAGIPSPTMARWLSRRIAPTTTFQSGPVVDVPYVGEGDSNALALPLPAANRIVCPRSTAPLVKSASLAVTRSSGTFAMVPQEFELMSTHGYPAVAP